MKNIGKKAVAARRAYQRKWRAENSDKVRLYNDRFWIKQAEKMSESQREEGSRNEK